MTMIQFPYVEYSDAEENVLWMPHVHMKIQNGENVLPVFPALLDTGATYTVLPSIFAGPLHCTLDRSAGTSVSTANGESCIYPSSNPFVFHLADPITAEKIEWESTVFFSDELKTVLIGHKECLERFDVTFCGQKKVVQICK